MRWAGHVGMRKRGSAYKDLVGKPKEKRPLGRPRRKQMYNIKMNLQDVGWREWSGLVWLRTGTGGRHL
jgi:hypothetical protein